MRGSVLKSFIPVTAATLAVVAVVELAGLHASQATAPAARAPVDRPPVDRALLDKYCVTCHNERLKTAGLTLDKVDLTKIGEHAATLEKVVQKLRSGQMPPDGRPRPEKPDVDRFVTSLETALDRATEPNPGRVATHRLNRLEYVNVIRDLLDLDIDPDLLPADSPGLGFDNNADILSVTPALVNRYMSAASKISRLALGDPTQRPANSIYRVAEFAAQDARMSEDLPFGTHGGLAVRHTFPLDGEYAFKVRMQRNTIGDTIRGLDDEHEVELRIDRKLVKRFRVGGQYKGYDPGFVNSAPDDDVEGKKLHTYRLNADEFLQLQLPVKAGPHLVTAAFTDSAPAVSELVPLVPSSLKRSSFTDDSGEPGIESVAISGPQEATSAQDTPSRRRIFVCQPTGTRDADTCARTILSTLARRAYRRPLNDADLQELMRLYTTGSKEGGFEAGIGLALETLLWSPAFLIRMEHDRAGATAGAVQRVSDLELASRLSFFLWKSAPDDTLLALAAKGRLSDPAVRAQQVARMMADPKSNRWIDDFTDQWLTVRNIQTQEPDPDLNPDFDDTLREAMAKETELFVASQVRDDRSLLELFERRLHLPERPSRPALQDPQRLWQPFPAGRRGGSGEARAARTGEHSHGDLVRESDLGRAAREVGARDPAGGATAAAAGERAATTGKQAGRGADLVARTDGAAPQESGLRVLPHAHGSTGLRARELRRDRTMAGHGIRPAHQRGRQCVRRHDRWSCRRPRLSDGPGRRSGPDRHQEAARVCAGPQPGVLRRPGASSARTRRRAKGQPLVVVDSWYR